VAPVPEKSRASAIYLSRKLCLSTSMKIEASRNPPGSQQALEFSWPPLEKDKFFISRDKELIWKKYCGFLDLNLDEFMIMQKLLLMEQIELTIHSVLGRNILGVKKPLNINEFRQFVPLTRYEDYQPYLGNMDESVLTGKPHLWARTSGHSGFIKRVPFFTSTLNALADDALTAFILSSATRKGEVLLEEGARVVLNIPPMPYTTGIMGHVANQRMSYQAIPPLEETIHMAFEERIEQGFKMALSTGIDYAASIAVVLAQVGESFGAMSRKSKTLPNWHPMAIYRVLIAILRSKLLGRPMLPKDIWKIKGLVCGGTDAGIYRERIFRCWGLQPLDVYVSTETCFIAMQSWNKKGMTFLPYRHFYEFIPEEEWEKSRDNKDYQPSTVLINEVQEGQVYELVITNFHGGPFIRYRMGDLIKIVSLKDDETGVNLPQMVFHSRADDIIDIAGFPRLDEKTIWNAIKSIEIQFIDWIARKEQRNGVTFLHVYIESPDQQIDGKEAARRMDQQFSSMDSDYKDLKKWITHDLVEVTFLKQGSFASYAMKKQASGADLSHWKPPHTNPSERVVHDLIY
jgi:hypothetical protein